MKFGNCANCGTYKYLKKNRKCPTCIEKNNMRNRINLKESISALGGERDSLIVGKEDGSVSVIDIKNRSKISDKKATQSEIKTICSSKGIGISYVVSKNGKAVEYQHATDSIYWKKDVHNSVQAGATVSGTAMYNMYQTFKNKSSRSVESVIQCFDIHKRKQKKRWGQLIDTPSKNEFGEDIVSDSNSLYIGTNQGNLLVRHLNSGNRKVLVDLGLLSNVTSMAVDDQNVYCGVSNGDILKVDKSTISKNGADVDTVITFSSPVYDMDADDGLISGVVDQRVRLDIDISGSSKKVNSKLANNRTTCTKILNSEIAFGEANGDIIVN